MATINACGNGLSGTTGTGLYVGQTSPSLITPALGTPSSGTLTNCTGLPVAGGGTGLATMTTYAILTGGTTSTGNVQQLATGSTGQVLQSNGNAALATFSTATFPSTATSTGTILRADGTNWVATTATFANTYSASNLLYSNGANTVTGLATANSAVLVTNSSGVPAWSGTMTNGQLIIGSTTATPTAGTLTAGAGIAITNGAASITIAATASGFTIVNQNTSSVTMSAESAYYINNGASLVTLTLPTSAAQGDTFRIIGGSSGGWKIAQNSGQLIHITGSTTTTGATGSLASANQYDCVDFTCITANTTFVVLGQQSAGLTVV